MNKPKTTIGRAESVSFPKLTILDVSARIDTGAKTSSLWASHIKEKDSGLVVTLFDGKKTEMQDIFFDHFEKRAVASSNGHVQVRYVVRTTVELAGRRINARFTLADRSTQVYPVLVGRNVLHGKFLVDVSEGDILKDEERQRSKHIQQSLEERAG